MIAQGRRDSLMAQGGEKRWLDKAPNTKVYTLG